MRILNKKTFKRPRHWLAFSISPFFITSVCAQGVATEKSLEPVVVTGTRSPLDPNLPTTTESRTAAQLREQNFVNVEDALKYLPSLTIRKRYIGDRNALIGGRSSSELQAPRALVYADGYLLSHFLGQFNAPRWNVVAPEEIARTDVLYGPYSALYPVILLSPVPSTDQLVKALDAGADEFIALPFDPIEFLARLQAVLRSYKRNVARGSIALLGFELNRETATLSDRGLMIELTPREFAMAWLFFSMPGAYLSRDAIAAAVWGTSSDVASRTIEQHVYKLRKKLNLCDERGLRIRTAYTRGYRLERCVEDAAGDVHAEALKIASET